MQNEVFRRSGGAVCCELGLRGRWLDAIIGKHVVAAAGPPPPGDNQRRERTGGGAAKTFA